MTSAPPDGSRDRRIEDPTNLYVVHRLAAALLPRALRAGVPADWVSLAGLLLGIGAAFAFAHWTDPRWVVLGLLLATAWLVADGLDGKIARATGTCSREGRMLDGVVDHGVFILIYAMLADSFGDPRAWALAVAAGAAHAIQSSVYEGERARFHRRIFLRDRGRADHVPGYDHLAGAVDRVAAPFDEALETMPERRRRADAYAAAAVPAMRLQSLLSANVRVLAIFAACLTARPELFWWFELVPLTLVMLAGVAWHRRVEVQLLHQWRAPEPGRRVLFPSFITGRSSPKDHI